MQRLTRCFVNNRAWLGIGVLLQLATQSLLATQDLRTVCATIVASLNPAHNLLHVPSSETQNEEVIWQLLQAIRSDSDRNAPLSLMQPEGLPDRKRSFQSRQRGVVFSHQTLDENHPTAYSNDYVEALYSRLNRLLAAMRDRAQTEPIHLYQSHNPIEISHILAGRTQSQLEAHQKLVSEYEKKRERFFEKQMDRREFLDSTFRLIGLLGGVGIGAVVGVKVGQSIMPNPNSMRLRQVLSSKKTNDAYRAYYNWVSNKKNTFKYLYIDAKDLEQIRKEVSHFPTREDLKKHLETHPDIFPIKFDEKIFMEGYEAWNRQSSPDDNFEFEHFTADDFKDYDRYHESTAEGLFRNGLFASGGAIIGFYASVFSFEERFQNAKESVIDTLVNLRGAKERKLIFNNFPQLAPIKDPLLQDAIYSQMHEAIKQIGKGTYDDTLPIRHFYLGLSTTTGRNLDIFLTLEREQNGKYSPHLTVIQSAFPFDYWPPNSPLLAENRRRAQLSNQPIPTVAQSIDGLRRYLQRSLPRDLNAIDPEYKEIERVIEEALSLHLEPHQFYELENIARSRSSTTDFTALKAYLKQIKENR